MLHHLEINVSNLAASCAFWSEILSKLGYKVTAYREEDFALSNGEDAYLKFVRFSRALLCDQAIKGWHLMN
jgi:hypothetical protein